MSSSQQLDAAEALRRLQEEMAGPPFHRVLRPEAIAADPQSGTVVVRLPFQEVFSRSPAGSHYHGGVIAALIDLTAHAAIAVKVGHMVPTIDLRIDYLHAIPGEDLLATGRVLRAGRNVAVGDVEVRASSDRILAAGRGVFSTALPTNDKTNP